MCILVLHMVIDLTCLSSAATVDAMKAVGEEWVLANINVLGYYRVNYDQGNWDRLLDVLGTNHEVRTAV